MKALDQTKGGFYGGLHIEEYAADPCPRPSLDTRTAMALRDKSPMHARFESPRYNPDAAAKEVRAMDLGTAFHSIVLEGKDIADPAPYADYKKADAREWRDAAKANGFVPLVHDDYQKYVDMLTAFKSQGGFDILGTHGHPEISGFYRVGSAWVRTRPDWLVADADPCVIVALKTVGAGASREDVERRLYRDGWDLQNGSAILACRTLLGRNAVAGWLVIEQDPPYGMAYYPFNAAHSELAARAIDSLARAWGGYVDADYWPGYGTSGMLPVGYKKWDADAYRLMLGLDE